MLRLHPCELVNFFGVRPWSRCPNELKLTGLAGRQSVAGRRAGTRDVSPRNWVNFGWRSPGVSPSGWVKVVGRENGRAGGRDHVSLRKLVNFDWLLPRVLLAKGVRVSQAGRPGRRDHVSPGSACKLLLAFAPILGWEEHVQADKPWYNYYIAV